MAAHKLPTYAIPFIGRAEELRQIATLLDDPTCRLLTLTGPGGIGKTRLAIQAAADQQLRFARGVHFVPLTSINSPDQVASAIAAALQVSFYSVADPRDQIMHYLRDQHLLLVLDNFEHVLEATDLLTEILQSAPPMKCLVTSRERLNLREEWVLTLEGLPFPQDDADAPMGSYSAVQLFCQRARQVQATFSLKDNLEAVKIICQRVEGMPLAIELAATWLRVMSCRQIAAQLDDSLNFLITPLRNVPERHRSMRVVFEQSWNLLSPTEQRVMMGLSVFRGGFDREAAEAITGASLSVLASLADKSMIRLNAAERYDLHELLRQYVADKLAEAGEADAVGQRHGDYFLKLAESADAHAFGREQIAWFDRLEVELDNLRVAVVWSADTELGLRLAGALGWFFSERGRWSEGQDWLERTLAANPDASPSIRARALCALAALVSNRSRALALCDEAFTLARAVGDRWNLAWALSQKGIYGISDHHDSAELLDVSLALFRDINDPMGIAHTLVRRSWNAWERQDYAHARLLLDEAGMIAQKAGDKIIMGWVMHGLGIIARHQHDLEHARLQFISGLAFFREVRFMRYDSTLLLLAVVNQELGNGEQARMLYRDALLSMRETFRSDQYLPLVFHGLAWLAWNCGQSAQYFSLRDMANSSGFSPNTKFGEITNLDKEAATLRDYLGDGLFARMWEAGSAMTLDQAITYLEDGAARIAIQSTIPANDLELARPQTPVDKPLTERELEIVRLVADGFSNREIAEKLFLAVSTIKSYNYQIFSKLYVTNRTQAVARARELGLLT